MIFWTIIGIIAWFILPLILYLAIIEKLDYRYKNIELDPIFAWFVILFQLALGAQVMYWIFYPLDNIK